ncbi:MAG: rhomboid family intramembrane serine protease [Planctomycetaceae bacterium]
MIPLRDNIPARTFPFVNYAFIGICAFVFFLQVRDEGEGSRLVEQYGMIPARVSDPAAEIEIPVYARDPEGNVLRDRAGRPIETTHPAAPSPAPAWATLVTCIFLHGGWLHFLGNMWFLYIFGDNVEDRFGHVGYAIFYLAMGAAASAAHYVVNPASPVPTIGASGAIAGVMGGYLLLYPHARVLAIVPLFVLFYTVVLPAPIFLGVWFVIQLVQVATVASEATGVAWWAHIGGFAAGMGVAWILKIMHYLNPPADGTRPYTTHRVRFR